MTTLTDTARSFAIVAGLTFDPTAHAYAYQGRVLPGVTQILDAVGITSVDGIPLARLAYKRSVGTAVATGIYYLVHDDLDVDSIDPAIAGYLAAFDRFRNETGFVPEPALCERPLVDVDLGFAGTPDLPGVFPDGVTAVLDAKCSAELAPGCAIQTAAYARLLSVAGYPTQRRAALHLKPDGTYHVQWHEGPKHRHDFAVFTSALAIVAWRRERGLL